MSQLLVNTNFKNIKYNNPQNKSNSSAKTNNRQQSFTGLVDGMTGFFQSLEAIPMLKVGFVDTVATNVPRTVVDLKTGIPAALETARREFSGLIVNCLIPSFFVLGAAHLINKPMMKGFKGINLANSWSDEATINKMASLYKASSKGNRTKNYVARNIAQLEVFEDNGYKQVSQYMRKPKVKDAIRILSSTIDDAGMSSKATSKAVKNAYELLAEELKATEVVRYAGSTEQFTSNLSELLRDHVDLGRKFAKLGSDIDIDNFAKKAIKMVKTKSLLGLAVIVPLAMSVQKINRAITRHKYKKTGAPIYKDFEKGEQRKPLTPEQNQKFFVQKCLSAASMVGLAVLSMMKIPTPAVLGKMVQFKGMFPTLDQCRIIATSTFASRMFASEDPNELRESTVRDIASFSGLYFLGDYAEKGVATLIEHVNPKVKLLNRMKPDDKTAFFLKRFWNWVRNYKIKSFDEVPDVLSKNMRSVAQAGGLAFSIISLGVLLPIYNRKVTEKKERIRKELEAQNKQTTANTKVASLPNAFRGILNKAK